MASSLISNSMFVWGLGAHTQQYSEATCSSFEVASSSVWGAYVMLGFKPGTFRNKARAQPIELSLWP